MATAINAERLEAAKQAFSTRRVEKDSIKGIRHFDTRPQPGDVVLARVMEVGRLERLELPGGRRSALYPGDELILSYGNRYAPDAYEALIPKDLGPCDLAAAGGLAATVVETNLKFADEERPPTRLLPVGLCVDAAGGIINLADYSISETLSHNKKTSVISVFGASMNAGKTTTAAGIIRGLAQQGLRVGAAKVTGTCSGGDLWKFLDAGCYRAYDFTDAGMATTYKVPLAAVRAGAQVLIARLEADGCDAIVVEIADGLYQHETAGLLQDNAFRSMVDHWVFAADSAASIAMGMRTSAEFGLSLSAVSGVVTASPLALREAMQLTEAPIFGLDELELGAATMDWINPAIRFNPVVLNGGAQQMVAL